MGLPLILLSWKTTTLFDSIFLLEKEYYFLVKTRMIEMFFHIFSAHKWIFWQVQCTIHWPGDQWICAVCHLLCNALACDDWPQLVSAVSACRKAVEAMPHLRFPFKHGGKPKGHQQHLTNEAWLSLASIGDYRGLQTFANARHLQVMRNSQVHVWTGTRKFRLFGTSDGNTAIKINQNNPAFWNVGW